MLLLCERRRLLGAVAALGMVGLACGGNATSPTFSGCLCGSWILQTVNGSPLPYTIAQVGTTKTEITGVWYNFYPDLNPLDLSRGSFVEWTNFRDTQDGHVSSRGTTDSGSFSLNGEAVTVVRQRDGSIGLGFLSGDTLRMVVNGFAFVLAPPPRVDAVGRVTAASASVTRSAGRSEIGVGRVDASPTVAPINAPSPVGARG